MPGSGLATRDVAENKIKFLLSWNIHFSKETDSTFHF